MDAWNATVSFWDGLFFQCYVSFRECKASVFFGSTVFSHVRKQNCPDFFQALKPNLQQLLEHGIFPQALVGNPLGDQIFGEVYKMYPEPPTLVKLPFSCNDLESSNWKLLQQTAATHYFELFKGLQMAGMWYATFMVHFSTLLCYKGSCSLQTLPLRGIHENKPSPFWIGILALPLAAKTRSFLSNVPAAAIGKVLDPRPSLTSFGLLRSSH